MLKYFVIFFFLIFFSNTLANNKEKIIEKLKNTRSLVFEFEQNINGKIENGNCIIEYPKKIYCKYLRNNKILVSNGKSLVIKTISSFYRYPLKRTPLNLILDKKILINKIYNLKEETLETTFINFKILENDHEINIFFDNEIEKINSSLRSQAEPDYIDEILNFADEKEIGDSQSQRDKDELYQSALEIIRSEGKASTSFLQRKLQIGYNRAARIIDMMEANGIVSKANHVGKRDVL